MHFDFHARLSSADPAKVKKFVANYNKNTCQAAMFGGLHYGGHDFVPNGDVISFCKQYFDRQAPLVKLDLGDKGPTLDELRSDRPRWLRPLDGVVNGRIGAFAAPVFFVCSGNQKYFEKLVQGRDSCINLSETQTDGILHYRQILRKIGASEGLCNAVMGDTGRSWIH